MKYKPVRDRCCQNENCQDHGKFGKGNIIRFTTDGFEPYSWAAKKLLDSICLYAQVIKKRRKNRVIKVERRLIIGTKQKMEQLLFESEDSSTVNTSFVERLNLTIRQGCAYLGRRTACHSRHKDLLANNLSLQMCYYNFVRLHSALKFGDEIRTPAMQAGLVKKQLSFREIFTVVAILFWWFSMLFRIRVRVEKFSWSLAQQQQLPEKAPDEQRSFYKVQTFNDSLIAEFFSLFLREALIRFELVSIFSSSFS